MNAKESLVGLLGLDMGYIRRGDHGHDHFLYVFGDHQPSEGRTKGDLFPYKIQWPDQGFLV